MKDVIDEVVYFYENLARTFVCVGIVLTSPIWILPYAVLAKRKDDKHE